MPQEYLLRQDTALGAAEPSAQAAVYGIRYRDTLQPSDPSHGQGHVGKAEWQKNPFSGPELPWLVQKTLKVSLPRPWEIRAPWRHQGSRVMLEEGFLTVLPFTGSPNTYKMSLYSTTTLVGSCTVNESKEIQFMSN